VVRVVSEKPTSFNQQVASTFGPEAAPVSSAPSLEDAVLDDQISERSHAPRKHAASGFRPTGISAEQRESGDFRLDVVEHLPFDCTAWAIDDRLGGACQASQRETQPLWWHELPAVRSGMDQDLIAVHRHVQGCLNACESASVLANFEDLARHGGSDARGEQQDGDVLSDRIGLRGIHFGGTPL
jgi:hypothetical protein